MSSKRPLPSGVKGQQGEGDAEQSSSSAPKTPTKADYRADGHVNTPTKDKYEYDFWGNKPKKVKREASASDENVVPSVNLAECKVGTFVKDFVDIRVTFKSYKKITKTGWMFDFHGLDKSGTYEGLFVCWSNTLDLFFDIVEIDKIIRIQNFGVDFQNVKYSGNSGFEKRMILKVNTIMTVLEDDPDFPKIPFKLTNLGELENEEVESIKDCVGIVVKVWELEIVKGFTKRDVSITDRSKELVLVTLWGSTAENFEAEPFCTVAIRKSSIKVYNQIKSLNANTDTLIWTNPKLDEADELKKWFDEEQAKRG